MDAINVLGAQHGQSFAAPHRRNLAALEEREQGAQGQTSRRPQSIGTESIRVEHLLGALEVSEREDAWFYR